MPLLEVVQCGHDLDRRRSRLGFEFGEKLRQDDGARPGQARLHRQPAAVPYLLDAMRAYEEGVGSIEQIDAAMKAGAATRWAR